MIKKLQRKFVRIAMLTLFSVLVLVMAVINGINLYQTGQKSETLLNMLLDNNGQFPDDGRKPHQLEKDGDTPGGKPEIKGGMNKGIFGLGISAETPFETRYFSAVKEVSGAWFVDVSHVAAVTEEDALEMADQVEISEKSQGYLGQYRYKYGDNKNLLVFVDCRNDISGSIKLAVISGAVGAGCLLLVFILLSILSRRAIFPVIQSMEKQKQFITDAGHEIKTPIAIISANTEVIEMCDGESEWTRSIRNQVRRLSELVSNLLVLARLDESEPRVHMEEIDFSRVVKEAADSFEAVASGKGVCIERRIEEGICKNADNGSICQLVSILLDNAVKYAPENGRISVVLKKTEHHRELVVYNDCEEIPDGDLNRLFDRFYRADESRSRESGGYGIGLSIAQAIVQVHKGKIIAKRKDTGLCFIVYL